MAWPVFTPLDRHRTGSGFLLAAVEGTPLPTFTSVNGVFTNSWDSAWKQLGRTTEDGISLTFGQENASYTSSQEAYPFLSKVTSRSVNASFTLYDYNQNNVKVALNGGNWSVTGSGSAQVSKYTPANPGEETYTMLAWIGPEDDEVTLLYKAFSSAEVAMDMTRDEPRPMPLNMQGTMPLASVANRPWNTFVAGQTYADPA